MSDHLERTEPVIVKVTEYLEISWVYSTGKTEVWRVKASRSGALLGTIKWYSSWRQYCFFPEPDCTFNVGCLGDIHKFISDANWVHKQRLAARSF